MKKWTKDSPGRFILADDDTDTEMGYVTEAKAMAISPMFLAPNQKWRGSYTTVDGSLTWRWFEHREDALEWVEEQADFVIKKKWVDINDVGEDHPLLSSANRAIKVLLAVPDHREPIIGYLFRQRGTVTAIVNTNLGIGVEATHAHPLPPLP